MKISNIHKRGFASLSPERRAEVAAMGGKAAHAKGTARVFSAGAEAREAGSKGGKATNKARKARRKP